MYKLHHIPFLFLVAIIIFHVNIIVRLTSLHLASGRRRICAPTLTHALAVMRAEIEWGSARKFDIDRQGGNRLARATTIGKTQPGCNQTLGDSLFHEEVV